MTFLIVLVVAVFTYVVGFVCGAEWQEDKSKQHADYLRTELQQWHEKYMNLLERNK